MPGAFLGVGSSPRRLSPELPRGLRRNCPAAAARRALLRRVTAPDDTTGAATYRRCMTSTPRNPSADRPITGAVAMMRSGYETGYELHPIQRLAAVAAASHWRDSVVTRVDGDGWIELVDLESQQPSRVWHYESIAVSEGEPVSLHDQYSVLAVGRSLYSVRG